MDSHIFGRRKLQPLPYQKQMAIEKVVPVAENSLIFHVPTGSEEYREYFLPSPFTGSSCCPRTAEFRPCYDVRLLYNTVSSVRAKFNISQTLWSRCCIIVRSRSHEQNTRSPSTNRKPTEGGEYHFSLRAHSELFGHGRMCHSTVQYNTLCDLIDEIDLYNINERQ